MMRMFGGSGLPPGVMGNGQSGMTVTGPIVLLAYLAAEDGQNASVTIDPYTITFAGDFGHGNRTQGYIDDGAAARLQTLDLWPGDANTDAVLTVHRTGGGTAFQALGATGEVTCAAGLGSHGVPAQSVPRALAQATINAIADSNAKTAMQALANALADIGALTIT